MLSAHQGHILVCGLASLHLENRCMEVACTIRVNFYTSQAQNLTTNVCQHNIQRRLPVQVIQGVSFFRRLRRQAFHVPFSSPPHRPSPPLLPRFSLASKIAPEAIRILNGPRGEDPETFYSQADWIGKDNFPKL